MSASEQEHTSYSLKLLNQLEQTFQEAQPGIYQEKQKFQEYMETHQKFSETVKQEYSSPENVEVFKALQEFDFQKAKQTLEAEARYNA